MSLSAGAEWLSALGAAGLPVLADAAVKGSAILAMACIASVFVRRASAATRHVLWFLAMVSLLVLPVLSLALPGWHVLPAWVDVAETVAPPASPAGPAPAVPESAVSAPPRDMPLPADGDPLDIEDHGAGRPPASAGRSVPSAADEVPRAERAPWWSAASLRAWIGSIWALGAAVAMAPVILGAFSLWRLGRSARRVTTGPQWDLLERLSAQLGLRRHVVLLESGRRSMPMAWGLVRPRLLIPAEAEGWPPGCLCAVLLHELAHVKRWDCLTQLVMRIACGLYWFNPLAWVAFRSAVAEHERACDDVVLAAGGKPSEYAEYLLDVASRLPGRRLTLGVAIALARPSRLEGRLLAILDGRRSRRAVTRAAMLEAILALAAVLVPLAALRPTVQAEQAAEEATASSSSASAEASDARSEGTPDGVVAGGTSHLRSGDTTDAGLKTFARLKNRDGVEVESIAGSKITDAGLKELRDFRNLRALNLACAGGVTDAGMKELKGCTGLRELHLVNTGVSDAGLAELKGLDALEALYLAGPKITDVGLKVLKDFKGLREVCLLGPTFTDAGLKELRDLKDLRVLHLRSAGITDAGLRELKGFTGLQVLSLPDTNITNAGLKELKGVKGLRQLNLRYTKVTDIGMRDVAEVKSLQMLDLTYTNVTDAGLKELEGLEGLRELHCVGAAVTEAGVERLRKALPEAKIIAGEGAGARPTLDPAAESGEPDSGASPGPAAPPAAPAPAAASGRPAPELAAADEVLKQLATIVELEERILAGAQERFRVGRGSEEDVGRQQVKVIDAKVRLMERKAELAARPKGDPRPPAPPPSAALAAEIRKHVATAVAQEEALLALVQERYRVGRATAEEFDRQQVRLAEAKVRLARLPAVPAAAPATPSDASVPAAPPRPAATPILKVRSTDGAAVADVHDGAVRVRLGDRTVEGPTIIISLDPVAAGAPRRGIPLTVRDGAVRMSADGNETLGAQITIHPDGRAEVSSREATDASPKAPAPAGPDAVRVHVAPDGSSMALTEAKPDFGTLDTGCADLGLVLVGEYGSRALSGSGGKWQVPAGWHAATGATLTRSDAAGTPWSLHGVSSWGRLARFDVRAGQVLLLRAGPPLSVKVHPSALQPNGMVHLALALVGQAGENYNAAPKRGGVPQPPRFRVFDEAGKALGSGVFNAGTAGTYSWCWWRVPEGFKGKYRVEVEDDWGPFEVARSEPEWFSVQ